MKGRPVDQLVYEHMFPNTRSDAPQNFHALLQRHLIPEVRSEVHSFYGHLDTHEAKYPGLDYTRPVHRIRLSRWPWHRRLFRAIDALRLTPAEIASLTKWEGTRWAKERYEREQGITIRDTAADDMLHWADGQSRPMPGYPGRPVPPDVPAETEASPDAEGMTSVANDNEMDYDDDEEQDEDEDEDEDDDEDELEEEPAEEEAPGQDNAEESDEEMESVGVALNERLLAQAARREAGETSVVMDEEWEQWLKNAIESGEFPYLVEHLHEQSSRRTAPTSTIPPRMLSAARAGQWHEIPSTLHDVIRCALDTETRRRHIHQQPSVSQPRTAAVIGVRGTVDRPAAHSLGVGSWRRMYGV